MAKSPPERLAAALRANLKRRKASSGGTAPLADPESLAKAPAKAEEKAKTPPPARG
jgi:hypothetical protein